jgi:hypothetical protein
VDIMRFCKSLRLAGLAAVFGVVLAAVPAVAAEHNWKMQTEWGGGPLSGRR